MGLIELNTVYSEPCAEVIDILFVSFRCRFKPQNTELGNGLNVLAMSFPIPIQFRTTQLKAKK